VIHQAHKHTSCYEKEYKGVKKCRFGMPHPPMLNTKILLPFPKDVPVNVKTRSANDLDGIKIGVNHSLGKLDVTYTQFLEHLGMDEHRYIIAIRSGINRPTVFLKRQLKDAFINAYNPELARACKNNMDIQFILDPYACSKYCAAYVSKSCRGMSQLINEVAKEVKSGIFSSIEKLRKFGRVFLGGTEVGSLI